MSRTDARSSSLRRRPSRSAPATFTAAVLTAAGVAGTWAAVARLSGRTWPGWVGAVHRWGLTTTWDSAVVITASVVVALVGLLLLSLAVRPGMPNAYEIEVGADPAAGSVPTSEFVMTRRSVATVSSAAAGQVSGVDSVRAVVSARRVSLTVDTRSAQAEEIGSAVTARVMQALGGIRLSPSPNVTTTVRTRKP